MRRTRKQCRGSREGDLILVEAYAPTAEFDHDPLPDQILGFALDQRSFGPRRLVVAFATHDGRFLALLHTPRTDPVDWALEACLEHFETIGRGGETHAAAVVLCDEPVSDGPPPPGFLATFERARRAAQRHGVHLVDWIACDDDMFRCARRRTFELTAEPGWWDAPDAFSA